MKARLGNFISKRKHAYLRYLTCYVKQLDKTSHKHVPLIKAAHSLVALTKQYDDMAQIHALLSKELGAAALDIKPKKSKSKAKAPVIKQPKTTPQATVTQPVDATAPSLDITAPVLDTTAPALDTTAPAFRTTTPALGTTTPALSTTTPVFNTTPMSLLMTMQNPLANKNIIHPSLLQYLQMLYKPKPKLKYFQKLGFEPPEPAHPKVTNTSMLTKSLLELKNRFSADMQTLSGVHSLPEYTNQAWRSYLDNYKYPFIPEEFVKPFLAYQKPLYAIRYSASIPKRPIQLRNLTTPFLNKVVSSPVPSVKPAIGKPNAAIRKPNPAAVIPNPAIKIPNTLITISKPIIKYPNPIIAKPKPAIIKANTPIVTPNPSIAKPVLTTNTAYVHPPVAMNTIVNSNNNNNNNYNSNINNPSPAKQQLIDKYIQMYQNFKKRPVNKLLAKQMMADRILKKQALTSLTQNLLKRPMPPGVNPLNIIHDANMDSQNYTHLMNDISGILQKYSNMVDLQPPSGHPVYLGRTPKRTLGNITLPARNEGYMSTKNGRSKVATSNPMVLKKNVGGQEYVWRLPLRKSARSNPASFLDSHGDLKVVPLTKELFSDLHSTHEMNGISTIIENFIKHEAIHPNNVSLVTANKNDGIPDDGDLEDDEYVGVDDQIVSNKRDEIPNVDICLQPSTSKFKFNDNLKYIRLLQSRMKQDLDEFNNNVAKGNKLDSFDDQKNGGKMNILTEHDNTNDDSAKSKEDKKEKKPKKEDDDFDDFNMSNFYNNNQGPKLNDDGPSQPNTQRMRIPQRPNLKKTRENLINTIFIDEERLIARQYPKMDQSVKQYPIYLAQKNYAKRRDALGQRKIPDLFGQNGEGDKGWEDFILR